MGLLEGSEGQPGESEGQPAGSEGQPEGGRTNGRTDGRNFSIFHSTSSPVGAAAQKAKMFKKNSYFVPSILTCTVLIIHLHLNTPLCH